MSIGVVLGARWHEVFERWLPGTEEPAPAAPEQLWTCGMHPQVIQDHPGQCPICHMELTPLVVDGAETAAELETDSRAITIDPSVVQNMGVKTALVREGALVHAVRAFGSVEEAEPNVHEVNLLVSGQIRRLHADTEGMRVAKHAPLFDLYSPELHAAIEESIQLRLSNPSADLEGASGTGRRSLYSASLQRLELWGLSSAQARRLANLDRAPRSVTFTSPGAGIVTQKSVVEGSIVAVGDTVMRIVDLGTVWIEAKLFEQHIGAVSIGQDVTATVASFPGERFAGKVVFIDPYVDPDTRTTIVRFAVDNAEQRLRPGMYASIEFDLVLAATAMVVPSEAVIDTGTRKVAFVALGGGRFEPREVETGFADGAGQIQVLAGLSVGEDVVTSGQFLLDSESRTREAVKKFLREREAGASDPSTEIHETEIHETEIHETERPEPIDREPPEPAETPEPPTYTCPMHPEVRATEPGPCPLCGMDLVPSEAARK